MHGPVKAGLFAIAAAAVFSVHAATSLFPMRVGDVWTYDAEVEWTLKGTNKTMNAKLPWTTKVVDAVEGPHGRAVVVRDFPFHLAWLDPAEPREPAFDVIVVRPEGLWIDTDTASHDDARERAGRAAAGETVGNQVLQFPLREKACITSDDDPDRPRNGSYCWYLSLQDSSANARAWHLEYRTLPDHEFLDFIEGVGFTEYTYGHHGTVDEVHAVLRGKPWRDEAHDAAKVSVRRTP